MKVRLHFLLWLTLAVILTACQPAPPPTVSAPTEQSATETSTEEAPSEATAEEVAYLNPDLPSEQRVEDLLARMTLEEKIGQMTLVEKNSLQPEDVTAQYIGGVLSGGGGYPNPPQTNTAEDWAEMVSEFQAGALDTRLAIPLIYGVDAVHGHNNLRGAVIFPHQIGLGAANNPDLVEEIGRITAIEMNATGIRWNYAPVVAVVRDIRWGRSYEGYSEDPQIVTDLGAAFIRGLQGDDLSAPLSALATAKHFIGDGNTTFGTASGDGFLDRGDTQMDEETLRAILLPPYQAAIEEGALSIMVSFSSWNGDPMHGHEYLVTEVLKQELGFRGFVVSDWGGIDLIEPSDYYASVVDSVNAGVDMNMVPQTYERFIQTMQEAVANGDIAEERIDDAVRRILLAKFEMGLFEHPYPDESLLELVGSAEHREVGRQAVRESMVLLKNEGGGLPLSKDASTIFVAGAADNIGLQSGGWTIEWQGSSGDITEGTTILEAIEEAVSADTQVFYKQAGNFADDAPEIAEIGVVVLAERPYAEYFGDDNDLSLSESDLELIQRMKARSEKLVVILLSGRPMIINEELALADSFIAAWLPGTEAQGVADVLFGDFPFTGKLPFTWPRTMEQLPFDFETLPSEGCDAPLFPLGYGLDVADTEPLSLLECP